MKVPLRLARQEGIAAADAFLVLASSYGPVVSACALLGERLPRVFAVRGGFVIVPEAASPHAISGKIRLRRLAADLFIPADASLLPALLPDEMTALTRTHGLVILPAGEVLAFDSKEPLPVAAWLGPERVIREEWRPFPLAPDRAERLDIIQRPEALAAVFEILRGGEPDDARPLPGKGSSGDVPEDARPPSGSMALRAAAGAAAGAGQLLAWLGRQLSMPGLAKLGAKLARKAIEAVPRISERLLGAQEAALREVLRQLKQGDVEKALRRAPIAAPDPDARGRVGTNADLGRRDPRYSLASLLGSGGFSSGWLDGGDVWYQLAEEYRRLAREAQARGDYRRAAYLYGVLLRDLRSAANALMAGGLFHDAAILFRDKVKDEAAAANAFDQAGDFDEALRLYDKLGRYEQAGDLLKRLDEHERASEYYTREADRLAAQGRWMAAGDLLRRKAGDRKAACRRYRAGWQNDGVEAVACAERLVDDLILSQDWGEFDSLVAEAGRRFVPPRTVEAGRFFNYAFRVEEFLPPEKLDDLRDFCRGLFASHLRAYRWQGQRTTDWTGELFGRPGMWPGPVVRDAQFATRERVRSESPLELLQRPVRLADGEVVDVVVARETFDPVIATSRGVVLWKVDEGRVVRVSGRVGQVLGLSVNGNGRIVFVLSTVANQKYLICHAANASGTFDVMGSAVVGGPDEELYLEPSAGSDLDYSRVVVAGPNNRTEYRGPYLEPRSSGLCRADRARTHLLVRVERHGGIWDWNDHQMLNLYLNAGGNVRGYWVSHWRPGVPPGTTLRRPPLDWITPTDGVLEVVGIDAEGIVHWSSFDGSDRTNPVTRSASYRVHSGPGGFASPALAVCLASSNLVVAATADDRIHWLQVEGTNMKSVTLRNLSVSARPVALVARPKRSEVLVILSDGSGLRVSER